MQPWLTRYAPMVAVNRRALEVKPPTVDSTTSVIVRTSDQDEDGDASASRAPGGAAVRHRRSRPRRARQAGPAATCRSRRRPLSHLPTGTPRQADRPDSSATRAEGDQTRYRRPLRHAAGVRHGPPARPTAQKVPIPAIKDVAEVDHKPDGRGEDGEALTGSTGRRPD